MWDEDEDVCWSEVVKNTDERVHQVLRAQLPLTVVRSRQSGGSMVHWKRCSDSYRPAKTLAIFVCFVDCKTSGCRLQSLEPCLFFPQWIRGYKPIKMTRRLICMTVIFLSYQALQWRQSNHSSCPAPTTAGGRLEQRASGSRTTTALSQQPCSTVPRDSIHQTTQAAGSGGFGRCWNPTIIGAGCHQG